jgi:hypothetical protein
MAKAAEAAAPKVAPGEVTGEELVQRTVCLELRMSMFGTSRAIDEDVVKEEYEADRSELRTYKRLLHGPELKQVAKVMRAAVVYVRRTAVPASILRGGVHLLPMAMIPAVEDMLGQYQQQLAQALDTLEAAYPRLKSEAQKQLGKLYDPADYPPVALMRSAFQLDFHYVTFAVPSSLAGLDPALFQREKAKAEARWSAAVDEIQDALRESFLGLIAHLHDKLKPEADGEKKVLRAGTVDKLVEFLDTFGARNVVDDGELAGLVEKARGVLSGVDATKLRDDVDLRAKVEKAMGGIHKTLGGLVKKRRRGIEVAD